MTALNILRTALVNIFADFSQTMRIFALPALLIAAAGAAGAWFLMSLSGLELNLLYAGGAITVIFCALWASVNFHRHILLDERFGWLPRMYGRAMLTYGIMAIPMGLILYGYSFALFLIHTEIYIKRPDDFSFLHAMVTFMLMRLILLTCITALMLRLFSLLPGVAIGEALRGYTRGPLHGLFTLILIAFILSVTQLVASAIPAFLMLLNMQLQWSMDPQSLLRFMSLWNTLIFIFTLIFGISLLTALYATYIRSPASSSTGG